MRFHVLTIFPRILDSYINEGIIKRAQKNDLIDIMTYDLRDWTADRHRSVDDTPYGGGAGMVMKIEPLYKALKDIKKKAKGKKKKVILFSAKGKEWNQQLARKYSKLTDIIMICGRYEGVDERIAGFIDEEISIGNYVLTGGELGALVVVDSVTRLLPGALGNIMSSEDESHAQEGVLEYPQYTRPEIFKAGRKKLAVPRVLLSGNHAEIEKWREKHKKKVKI